MSLKSSEKRHRTNIDLELIIREIRQSGFHISISSGIFIHTLNQGGMALCWARTNDPSSCLHQIRGPV